MAGHPKPTGPQLTRVKVTHRGAFGYVTGVLHSGQDIPLCRLRYGGSAHSFGLAIYSAAHDRLLAFLDELLRDSRGWDSPLRYRPDAYDHIEVAAGKLHVDRSVLDEIKQLLDDKGQVVLHGPPGTGKTYLAVGLAAALADGEEGRVSVVQFHPATTYEDFFEGLRPTVTTAGQITYKRTSGPLVAIAEKAAKYEAEERTFVLVIDELNRANLPKVFGELLFLMENRDKSARTLYRPEEPFRLPANLKIIGTMNTADRSIALIDAAMRRRFHFVPFFPHEGMMKDLLRRWLADGNGRAEVADFLDAVNQELLPIGPSHFMRAALRRIWAYNIFP